MSDSTAVRQRYVEQIKRRGRIASPHLLHAFANVPRERFTGEGPWRIRSAETRDYSSTADSNPAHIYEDVLVAIDESRKLHSGLPSLWASLFEALDIKRGERDI